MAYTGAYPIAIGGCGHDACHVSQGLVKATAGGDWAKWGWGIEIGKGSGRGGGAGRASTGWGGMSKKNTPLYDTAPRGTVSCCVRGGASVVVAEIAGEEGEELEI